ncbi:lytic murein transglycosylase [Micromonospora sp. NPDC047074]|uniref:lytic transglycosylase domain-containing protein n=1 Tax=Micromonospora sp. NPDC047074 TaxID=3154339 RepID=UPI0033D59D0D
MDGEDSATIRPLRPAAPADGPTAGSGVPPEPPTRLPRPRRPWLRSATPADAGAPAAPAAGPAEPAATPSAPSTPEKSAAPPAPDGKSDVPAAGTKPAAGPTTDPKPGDTPAAAQPADQTGADAKPADRADAKQADKPTTDAKPTDQATTDGKPADKPATDAKPADKTDAGGKPADQATTDGKPADKATTDGKLGAEAGGDAGTPATKADLAETKADVLAGTSAAGPRRRRVQFAHALRRPPHRVALAAARATRVWSRRPSGRLTLSGVFLLVLVAATGAAGALLVPATIRASGPGATDATSGAPTPGGLPGGVPLPTQTVPPVGTVPTGPPLGGGIAGRPADALAAWAAQTGPKVGIAPVALQAYGYAEMVLAQTNRSCGLSWTTLAAIGFVESGHGQANNATLGQDGKALPEIIGLPLDGQGGRMRIPDTDRGLLDKDTVLDRAVGPMQFIPTTWQEIGADADNDGVKDPHDLDDAALAAGNYLCKGGRNLTIPADWWNAILSYNDVRRYAQDVFDTANRYGQASRT